MLRLQGTTLIALSCFNVFDVRSLERLNRKIRVRNTLDKILRMRFAVPLLIACVLLLALVGELTYQRAKATLTDGIQLTDARIGAARLLQLLTDAETAQRGYLLTASSGYLEPLRTAEREFNETSFFLKFIAGLGTTGPEDAERIRATVVAKFAELNRTIAMAQAGDGAQALALVQSDAGKRLMDELRSLFKIKLNEAALAQQSARDSIYTSLMFNRIAVLVLSCILALGLYVHVRQLRTLEQERADYQRTLEKEVALKSEGLRTLAAWLETVREEEKSHLARELHDELGGILTAAKLTTARMRAKLADDPKLIELVEAVNLRLNEGIAVKRRIIEDLRPSTLTLLGLHVALENLCAQARQQLGVPVVADITEVHINRDAELAIFRIAQEALTNIGKYSKATHVSVRLEQIDDHIILKITDNGVGFDPNNHVPGRHGLAGMQFRMERHDGSLSVVSAPQQGVNIVAKMPRRSNI